MGDFGVRCADCDTHFVLGPGDISGPVACPACGGQRLFRHQPSPVHSDGELRDMVDPISQQDQGGNPLGEGTIMGRDGERPAFKRDNFMGKVAFDNGMAFDFNEPTNSPTHKFIVNHEGRVASLPEPTTHEKVAETHGWVDQFPKKMTLGGLFDDGSTDFYSHETPFSPAQLAQTLQTHFNSPVTIDPNLKPSTTEERFGLPPQGMTPDQWSQTQQAEQERGRPFGYYDNPFVNRGGSVDETFNMEPYLPWTHEAAAVPEQPQVPIGPPQHTAMVVPGPAGIHAGVNKLLSFFGAHVNGLDTRNPAHASEIHQRWGKSMSPEFGQPVTVAVHDPTHLPAAQETIALSSAQPGPQTRKIGQAIQQGQLPAPPGIDVATQMKPPPGQVTAAVLAIPAAEAEIAAAPAEAAAIGAGGSALLGAGKNLVGGIGGLAKSIFGGGGGGGLASGLMKRVLLGEGAHTIENAIGYPGQDAAGGAPAGSAGAGPINEPGDAPLDTVSHVVTADDQDTPTSNDSLDSDHDEPDAHDQKEFKDESDSTNLKNPEMEDSGASGEDDSGFRPDSPGLERAQILLPLLLHYFHSPQSGEEDPLVRGLHEILEGENPGYLNKVKPEHEQHLHDLIHGHLPGALGVTSAAIPQQPSTGPVGQPMAAPVPGLPGANKCPYCGLGPVAPDGTCSTCGARVLPSRASTPQPGRMVARVAADHQGPVTPEQKQAVIQYLIQHHRGHEAPLVETQPWNYSRELAEVANFLNVPPPLDDTNAPPAPAQEQAPPGAVPGPSGTGGGAPGGGMPPPMSSVLAADSVARRCPNCGSGTTGLANEEGDSFCHACGNTWKEDVMPDGIGRSGHVAADSVARRCPNCGSGTTGLANEEGDSFCHACGNTWKEDVIPDGIGRSSAALAPEKPVAPPQIPPQPNETDQAPPAGAERGESSLSWQDEDGKPLEVGQHYMMENPGFQIPDEIEIVSIKPQEIRVKGVNDDPSPDPDDQMGYEWPVTLKSVQENGVTFTPAHDGGVGVNTEGTPEHTTPGESHLPPQPQPTDQRSPVASIDRYFGGFEGAAAKARTAMINEYGEDRGMAVFGALIEKKKKSDVNRPIDLDEAERIALAAVTGVQSVRDPRSLEDLPDEIDDSECPQCGESHHIAHSMSSPETEMHDCYRCGKSWETRNDDYGNLGGNLGERSWVMDSSGPGDDGFWDNYERVQGMKAAQTQSRNLSDIASKDPRLQAMHDHLEQERVARQERLAGRKFTPSEQRRFIEEGGIARNSDLLDLRNTHYETRPPRWSDGPLSGIAQRANGADVPDEHLVLGL